MPELPDVEVFKQYLDKTSLNQRIEKVQILAPEILRGITVEGLRKSLEGHVFDSSKRHGKYLFVNLDRGPSLVLHFGMTGFLAYYKDKSKKPLYERLAVCFSNGYHLGYNSPRKLGKVTLTDDIAGFVEQSKLGTDAQEIDLLSFKEILLHTKSSVKSALMNQHLIAGIGNIYSDEMLFQVGIHPQKKASRLNESTLIMLFRSMQEVLAVAIKYRADPQRFREDFLIPHRRGDRICPRCGNGIETAKVSGRTACFCPHCQN
jgi:formamidopyrimidine-DNA glycosylase